MTPEEVFEDKFIELQLKREAMRLKIVEVISLNYSEENWDVYFLKPDLSDLRKKFSSARRPSWNNLDAQSWLSSNLYYYLEIRTIIRYTDITISNSRGQNHHIIEMYFSLDFNKDLQLVQTRGMRGDRTYIEHISYYGHSHLSGGEQGELGNLCFGSGPIRVTSNCLRRQFDADHLNLFCHHLNNFVKWESLEGTPYKYISKIGIGNVLYKMDYTNCFQYWRDYVGKDILTGLSMNHFNVYLSYGRVRIQYTDEFQMYLGELLRSNPSTTGHRNAYGIKGADGNIYSAQSHRNLSGSTLTSNVLFKGSRIVIHITDYDEDFFTKNIKFYANKSFADYCCGIIERNIKEKLYSSPTCKTFSECQDEDFSYITSSDDLVVHKDAS